MNINTEWITKKNLDTKINSATMEVAI